jgi:hypothetical protein
MRRILLPLSILLIALAILAPLALHPADLIYPAKSAFSDLTITHWPAFAYARDQLEATGQVPLWRTSILSGTPFAADPLAGLFYPLHWLALLLPLSIAFNLLILLHFALAAASMYLLMRCWKVGRVAAIASAFAYAAAPKIVAHMGVGHVTLVEAWAWLPLVLVELVPPPDETGSKGQGVVLSGLALAMCLLADARMAVYAGALAVTYVIVRGAQRDRSAWLRLSGHIAIVLIVAATVSAVSWLPALTLTGGSARAQLTPAEAAVQSLDPAYLLGVVIADRSGAAERTTYVGLVVLVLAVVGVKLMLRSQPRRIGWLIGVIAVGVLVALGVNTPLYQILYRLPGSTLLRVPARAWFVVTFAIAALAGFGLQGLIDWSGRAQRRSGLLLIGLSLFAIVFGALGGLQTKSISVIEVAIWIPIACLLIALRVRHRLRSDRLAALMIALIAIDLLSLDWSLYRTIPIDQAFADGRQAAIWLSNQPEPFRVYSPSYSIPQQVAQTYQLELADGIDPLQLARYVAFMQQASGEGIWKYSVTLPAFPNVKTDADIRTALANVTPNTALLGLLNVKYVVSAFPIEAIDLVEQTHFESTYIYENVRVLPRAFVVGEVDVATDQQAAVRWLNETNKEFSAAVVAEGLPGPLSLPIQPHEAQVINWQADQIEVRASGPGLLVFGEVYAPDWIATIDGEPTEIFPTDVTLRGVVLPWGAHTVELSYQPKRVYAGLLISVLSLFACAVAIGVRRFGRGFLDRPG